MRVGVPSRAPTLTGVRRLLHRHPPRRYGRLMGRKVASIGAALAAAGTLILLWVQPAPQVPVTVPIDRLINVLLSLLPLAGMLCASIGGIVLALAVVARVAGRAPLWGSSPTLLWLGLVAVVLASLVEVGMTSALLNSSQVTALLVVTHGAGVLRILGATLLACWLTARITSSKSYSPGDRGARVDSTHL